MSLVDDMDRAKLSTIELEELELEELEAGTQEDSDDGIEWVPEETIQRCREVA